MLRAERYQLLIERGTMKEAKSERKKSTTKKSSARTALTKSRKNASSEGSPARKGSQTRDMPENKPASKEATASSPTRTPVIDEQPELST